MTTLELTIATTNQGKALELREVLGEIAVVILPQDLPAVKEDGHTLRENAFKKARSAADYLGVEAIADDSGLFVQALDGLPGVHSARFAGEHASDADNRTKLLSRLGSMKNRNGYFETVLCMCRPGQDMDRALYFEGRCQGRIAISEVGSNGFGYDPVFIPTDGDGRTFGEMEPAEKARYSHRSRALFSLKEALLSQVKGE